MKNQKQKTVLLVEDDSVTMMVEMHMLQSLGYDVVTAKSGEEAVQAATWNDKIDIILMDIYLGSGMDGTEAATQILAKRHLPIVFLTAHTEKEYVERVKKITRYGYILKNSDKFVIQSSIEMAFELFEMVQAVRQSEIQKNAILNGITTNISLVDKDLKIIWANKAAADSANVQPEDMVGRHCYSFWGDPAKPCGNCPAFKAFKTRQSEHVIVQTPNGKIWDEAGEPVFDTEGNVIAVVEIAQDITERKHAEEALRSLFSRQQALLTAIPDIIVEVDNNKTITWTNFAGLEFFGDDVLGKEASFYFVGEQKTYGVVKQLFNGNEDVVYVESWQRRKDGVKRLLAWWCRVLKDGDGKVIGALSTARDITERKREEEERENLQAQLNQAHKMESVGRLAGGVAHDFNNMLQIILGNVGLVLAKTEPDNPICHDLAEIQSAGRRAADLTSQLLAFARKQTIAPRTIDLNETVASMLKMLRRLIGENIELIWLPCKGLWPIRMDPIQIDQILANLCVNARNAIDGVGTVHIDTQNVRVDEFSASRHDDFMPGDYVLLTVSDTGSGIDKEMQARIFEPFFTTSDVGKGTGLGLAIVYGIVRQNQGHINVYSEKNHGTIFRIYLPRHMGNDDVHVANGLAKPITRGSETVLLVEDEAAILNMTTKMLARQGYTVLSASAPGEALRMAEAHTGTIQMLMTDVVMPEMNGRELAKKLLVIYPHLKCLFMSGYTANVIAHHGVLDKGMNFIQKPFSMEDLCAKVRDVLARA